MANKFYDAGTSRAERVNDLFATIAPRYDLINDLQSFGLHRFWKRRLVKMAGPQPGERALDLCCGTGDVALAMARCGAEVVGVDFSAPMLAVAEERARAANAATENRSGSATRRAHFIRGDAQQVPFPDNSFDIVTISYGLRNLAGWEAGLREMWRVARPGGRLLVLDFGKPEYGPWQRLYLGYLRWIVPLFGRVFCGDSQTHGYILESLRHYPGQKAVAAKMQELGCTDVEVTNILGGAMSINFGRKKVAPETAAGPVRSDERH
jgi:demethylmenaquinone methyltransferase/2-methoxy-6-polyprenyl-1,4-benzoquinol methylase